MEHQTYDQFFNYLTARDLEVRLWACPGFKDKPAAWSILIIARDMPYNDPNVKSVQRFTEDLSLGSIRKIVEEAIIEWKEKYEWQPEYNLEYATSTEKLDIPKGKQYKQYRSEVFRYCDTLSTYIPDVFCRRSKDAKVCTKALNQDFEENMAFNSDPN